MQIEFPSILLPNTIQSGSIVDITVAQNRKAEQQSQDAFQSLQERILNTYGLHAPSPPILRLRNATQTSLVLEWDPIVLATSSLRSLALYRNGSKAGNIPRPMDMLSTKLSGLAINTEYSFYLVLRTSGGTYTSNTLTVKTHEMTNLTGITVTPGVLPLQLRESLETAIERIGARISETVRIDTTHFVCTEPRGTEWSKAVEMNIPVVRPEWVEGCEREGKIVGVRGYYLDADPKLRQVGTNPIIQQQSRDSMGQTPTSPAAQSQSQASLPSRGGPKSPDKVEGEPGPSVGPTPPMPQAELPRQQKSLPPDPPKGAVDEDSDDDDSHPPEDPEKQQGGPPSPFPPPVPASAESDTESEESASPPPQAQTQTQTQPAPTTKQKATVDEEKGEDMEDVAL